MSEKTLFPRGALIHGADRFGSSGCRYGALGEATTKIIRVEVEMFTDMFKRIEVVPVVGQEPLLGLGQTTAALGAS